MKIKSKNVDNNILHPNFGGYGDNLDDKKLPSHSFHLEWEKVKNAKSYALEFIDYDASSVIGFPFIHWIVANIKNNYLNEGDSLNNKNIVQGQNSRTPIGIVPESFKASSVEEASKYFGPYPPDRSHDYVIRIYALDLENLNLKNGYTLADLHRVIKGHVLFEGKCVFTYNKI